MLGHYIRTWAGVSTASPTTFERCVRLHFLRRKSVGCVPPYASSSGEFAYGDNPDNPRLQPRVAALAAVLRNKGFGRFQRIGEGTEAFVVKAHDLASQPHAIRVSVYGAHIRPDEDRLPCTDRFMFTDPADTTKQFCVTVAPVADTASITLHDAVAFARRQYARGHQHSDFAPENLGRYLGRVVLIDFGTPFDPIDDPRRAADSYAKQLERWALRQPRIKDDPQFIGFASELLANASETCCKALLGLGAGAVPKPARSGLLSSAPQAILG